MTRNSEWSEEEFDVRLYSSFDKEGQQAWRKLFGLPKLLNEGNPPAEAGKSAEIEHEKTG